MSPTAVRLRSLWFQLHKWLGITLAILVIPISLTGAALVWHDWLDEQINPQRFPAAGGAALPTSTYVRNAARLAEPGERVSAIRLPAEVGAVQVTLIKLCRTTYGARVRPCGWTPRLASRSSGLARARAC
jgi:uncharacterized iron-regulated membrane protein